MQGLGSRISSLRRSCFLRVRSPGTYSLDNFVARLGFSTKEFHDVGQPSHLSHPWLLKEGEMTLGITSNEYILRRERLIELLPEKSLAIIASAPVKMMTYVVRYSFRQDANYSYITGCLQPGGVAVLSEDYGFCMFMPDSNPQDVIWQGMVPGVDEATSFFKAEKAFPLHKLQESLLQTMIFSRMNPFESPLSTKVEYECKIRGAQRMAFNPVVGGGVNGSIIHYSRNDQKIRNGDFVLMDIGCEFNGYLSDLTRTWPPCGSFSWAQEVLYNLILETNKQCIKLCKPGICIQQIHNFSLQVGQSSVKTSVQQVTI